MSTLGLRDLAFLGGLGAGGGGATDPNTLLLISGRGANGSTAIVDSSMYARAITVNGNAQISTAVADPFGASEGVLAFDGSGDSLTVANSNVFDTTTTRSFELWFRRVSGNCMLWQRTGGAANWNSSNGITDILFISSNTLYYQFNNGAANPTTLQVAAPAVNAWAHVLISYNPPTTTTRAFLNGTQFGSTTTPPSLPTIRNAPLIGDYQDAGFSLNGQLAQIRYRDVATTANFTTPAGPFTP